MKETDEVRDPTQPVEEGLPKAVAGILMDGQRPKQESTPQKVQRKEDDPVQGVPRLRTEPTTSEVRIPLRPGELERLKKEQFLLRAREFLANDPYWVHVLVQDRTKRKQVAREFTHLMTTIPHLITGQLNRATRRKIDQYTKRQAT